MDASSCVLATLLVLSLGALSHQQNSTEVTTQVPTEVPVETSTLPPEPEQRNCSTARGLHGTCVERRACDHSTPAIDLTLFAPRWFIRQCAKGQACCPFDFLVQTQVTTPSPQDDSAFGFDDDDK